MKNNYKIYVIFVAGILMDSVDDAMICAFFCICPEMERGD